MAQKETWVNGDGIEVGFGPVVSHSLETNDQHTKGKTKELQLVVDASVDLPKVGEAHTSKDSFLPSGAMIVSARYIADVDFDQAVEFGTSQLDGTAIDQDGLIATGTTSAVGAGALIGTVTTEANYLTVTETTTAPTVGSGTLVVEYVI